LLLETVMATGLLVMALAAIGVQVQRSRGAIKEMRQKVRALSLAEQQLALLDLGLVELDSLDEVVEGDFGPMHPDWGWRLITEPTSIDELFLLTVEVLFVSREGEYRQDDFDYEHSEIIHTAYAFRPAPQAIDFALDFGLTDDEMTDLSDKMADLAIPGMDPQEFDTKILGKLPPEELLEALPLIMDAFGFQLEDLAAILPPDALRQIEESGLFDLPGEEEEEGNGDQEGEQ